MQIICENIYHVAHSFMGFMGEVSLIFFKFLYLNNKKMVHKLYEHVVTFIQKLKLIQSHLVLKKVVRCPVLSSRPTDTVQHEKYSDWVAKLADDFEKRFQDFRRHIGTMKLISNPFSIDPTDAAAKYQLEIIDIQNDSYLKTAFA